MRNRALHDALRDFALEAAALLTDELRAGAEIEFDVIDEGGRRGPALYRYKPRVEAFIADRWPQLRELHAFGRAAAELGAGASIWLRVTGGGGELDGHGAEPALRAMLERLYEDATSFGFPEERFERVYRDVESTLYRDAVLERVVAPVRGALIEAERVELGDGLALVRADAADVPPEAVEDPDAPFCVLERYVSPGEGIPAEEAERGFAHVVTALRLWSPGMVGLGAPGWRRTDGGPWQALGMAGDSPAPAAGWLLSAGEEAALRDFCTAVAEAEPAPTVAWALGRFEMGCERRYDSEALSDYLLALRALLDATSDAGEASLALRVAALCAEEGMRRQVQRRIEDAVALERFVMGGGPRVRPQGDSPRELVDEVEGHLRALLRDVLCGYLDADLKAVADDILLETTPEPFMEIKARDLRKEEPPAVAPAPAPAPLPEEQQDTAELEQVRVEPEPEPEFEPEPEPEPLEPQQPTLEGVTASADWGYDDPEDFSAPV